ncbi:MAG TPA: vWA domain-containing protein [Chitinophagaceae bacterium]|nr:vWA domain-containing protein [Chitinophagaceae bacterium]
MTCITNYRAAFSKYSKMLILLLIITAPAGISLHAQPSVELPLSTYPHDGVQPLTPRILVPEVQFQSPNVSILLDGLPLPAWLSFTSKPLGMDVDGDGINDYEIDLVVPAGQCVPVPPGAGACAAPASCTSVPAFATAVRRQCFRVDVTAFGTSYTRSLCVYGPDPMTITGPANTQVANGHTVDLPFSIVRPEETYTWSFDASTPMPSYLSFSDAIGKDANIKFTGPMSDLAEQTFKINVKNNLQSCDVASFTFKVSSKGDAIFTAGPVDIVLVVDVSGSMGETAVCYCKGDPKCPDPPSKSKLRYLKEQISALYTQMKALSRPTDRIGLVSFHTTSKVEKGLVPFSDNTLMPLVEAWHDEGYDYTCIGGGLKDAVSLLTDGSRKRYIILMTNGMQNEPPNLEWADAAKSTVKVGSTTFNHDLGIIVIPIAIFTPSGEYRNLLNALGKGTGVTVVKDVCDANVSLLTAYTEAAKSIGSPKIVTFKRDVFAGNTATGTFTINENLDQMLVNIINVGNQNFSSFKIEKNISNVWTDITSLGAITPGIAQSAIRRLFTMNFPAVLNGSPLNSSGDYRYTVNSTITNVPYEFSVMIDDRGVKHTALVGKEYYQSGDPINLAASVFFNGSPVTNATVVVSLESPIVSFSSGFSRANVSGVQVTKVPLTDRSKNGGFGSPYIKHFAIKNAAIDALRIDGDRMNTADRKYFVLRHETGFGSVFQTTGSSVTLPHVSNGIYKAQFTGVKNVGLYTMHFLITANVPGVGNVTRMDEKDVYVNFGKPVLDKSNLYVMWEQPVLISFTPKDMNDNLLGPGQADQISVYMSKGNASAANDYLDGRYVVKLNGINYDDNPDIIIRINKDVLYNGKLSGLSRKRAFISLVGGYNFPQGSFANGYSSNFMGELKGGYRFWKNAGLQAHFGYYSFKGKSGNASQPVIGGGIGAFYRFPLTNSQGWNMIAELNGGYYKPKSNDGGFGINGGIGFNAFISYRLSLVVEGKYYTIYTSPDNINFVGSAIGLKYHF